MRLSSRTLLLLAGSATLTGACISDDLGVEPVDRADEAYLTAGTGVPLEGAPKNVRIEAAGSRSLLVAFDDAAGDETGFSMQRNDFGTWNQVALLPATPGVGTTSSFNDSVDSEQDYCYRVRSFHTFQMLTSATVCGRTEPPSFPYAQAGSGPLINLITHPAPDTLAVRWVDTSDKHEWTLEVRSRPDGPLEDSIPVKEAAGDTNPFQTLPLEDLDADRVYCFKIVRGSASSRTLCARPSRARTSVAERDPEAPHIEQLAAPAGENAQLRLVLSAPQPGQVLERYVQGQNRRESRRIDTQGAGELVESGLEPGKTYCYYVWVANGFGTRYSNTRCATPTFVVPSTPGSFHVVSQDDHDVRLGWSGVAYADDYEVHYHGTRPAYQTKDGDKSTDGTTLDYQMSNLYTYCFKVRARNAQGVSAWSPELCGLTPGSSETSYGSSLKSDTPTSGFQLYSHTVNPGGSAHLTRVHVAGSGATPYLVHFLPPGASQGDCNDDGVGVFTEPGDDLDSDGLSDLYGSASPATPLALVACKMWRSTSPPNNDPMPIQVYFEP